MDLEFTPDQEELRTSVRAVLGRECPPSLVRELVEKGTQADDLWTAMVELDWPALTIDTAHGGLGLGFVELAVVVEELGRAIAPGPFLPTVTQFVPAIREAGTPEQQDRFLGGADSFPSMTAKVTCGMFQMFLRPAQCLADLPIRFGRICLSAWPERWPCLARPAPLRGHKREDHGCQSRQTHHSCAHEPLLSSEFRLGPGSLHFARLENSQGA